MRNSAIIVSDISKKFKIFSSPRDRLKEALSFTRRIYHKEFWALKAVSFCLDKGQTMGIIGINGSGKSTLLKIICGYLSPTSGHVKAQGRIASILELGTGFNNDFTGRENVILYAGLMGLSKKKTMEIMPLVEQFADIGDFFDRPVRLYSSGMFTRLAFACTIHMDPDILIIDEALAVGDIAFQHKCIHRIKNLQEKGITILFVSHSIAAVKSLCQQAILLDKGSKIMEGTAEEVANYYHGLLARKEEAKSIKTAKIKKPSDKHPSKNNDPKNLSSDRIPTCQVGTGEIRIKDVFVMDMDGCPLKHVKFNQQVRICTRLKASITCRPAVFGCLIRDRFGMDMLGTNTAVEGIELPDLKEDQELMIEYHLRLPLHNGSYSITAAIGHDPDRPVFYDWQDNCCIFEMLPPDDRKMVNCKVHLPIRIEIKKRA